MLLSTFYFLLLMLMYWFAHPSLSNKTDKYGFINEHEVRIATGITFVMSLISLCLVLLRAEYTIPLVLVSIVTFDFIIKVILWPQYSIFGSFVRLFLNKKKALWVGTVQKRFAWSLGIFLSIFVIYCLLILGGHVAPSEGPQAEAVQGIRAATQVNIAANTLIVAPMNPAIIACLLCIIFMWSESVAGYCVGCAIYKWFVKKWRLKQHHNQNCVDGACEI